MRRMRTRSRIMALGALALTEVEPGAAQTPDGGSGPPTLEARRLAAGGPEIRLDGRLRERAWSEARPADSFRQREPDEGAPATERTEVRVVYDDEYLYIGIHAFDDEPGRIIARQLARDASLDGDDALGLILDTFNDHRNAYYFATNPAGVQVDGLIVDESEDADLNWDGVWDVRSRQTADGWTAEFAIPLRTLRFPANGQTQTWGLNVQRVTARKNEESLWTAWSRDNEGLFRVSRAGELLGLESLHRGLDLTFKPYGLGEAGRDYVESPDGRMTLDADAGLDAKLGFSSGLVLDLTLNTDFAQVEADDEQVDLTRFSLFFPEKREFFLENAGIFDFGARQFFGPPHLLLFFSRRIGLQETGEGESRTVPIIGGARLTGRVGRQTVGALNVTTASDASLGAPLTNFSVARVKRDIGRRSYVGAIATSRMEEGGFENLSGGADWSLWLSNRLVHEGLYARTAQSGPGGEDDALRFALDYTSDWWGWFAEYLQIGANFTPDVGFVLRTDIARSRGAMRFSPRPPIPGLRKIDIRGSFEYIESEDTRDIRDRRFGLDFDPELDSGDEFRISLDRRFQRLDAPFELDSGVVVPEGDYRDWALEAEMNTSPHRPVAIELSATKEGFWAGDRWQLGGGVNFYSPHLGLELGYDHNKIEVPAGSFTTDLVRTRVDVAVSTRLFGSALIQYNSQSERFSTNLRLDFIHRPGSDLFVVFNDRRDTAGGAWNPVSRALIVKLTYLYWF